MLQNVEMSTECEVIATHPRRNCSRMPSNGNTWVRTH